MIIDVEDYLDSLGVLTHISESEFIKHYGTPRHSGRYPWGSGGNEGTQRNQAFLDSVNDLKKQGLSEVEIAQGLGMTTTQLRDAKTIAKNAQKQANIAMAQRLKDKGMSNGAIAERMGLAGESSVRALLADGVQDKLNILDTTSSMLRDKVDSGAYLDVGTGVELHMGVSRKNLDASIALLKEEGYSVVNVQIDQLGTQNKTLIKVLAKPGTEYKDIVTNKDNIQQVRDFSDDGGRTYLGIKPPLNVDLNRIGVRYAEDGGADADGVLYIRPGVKDVSIGNARYAQVRVAVNGTHFLKGMAVYKDDLPDGVDILFNTNKSNTGNKLDAMKPLKDDPDNPFGSTIRQIMDATGKVTSAMNIVGHKDGSGEEGSWDLWSRNLPSQFLSKQSPTLAKQQLDMTYSRKRSELDEIKALTNPAVKRKLLESYADGVDSSSVHLKAAALPRQATRVLLPVNSLRDTEVYAPGFKNGERVALVRFPHGGTFEIPELTVNNKHAPAAKMIGKDALDAIGINSKVAARLSGADFDGDTVLVIPNTGGRVKSTKPLEALKDFDPQRAYPEYPGMKRMTARTKGIEMGQVSNLITDMTIKGASASEIARAVRHSMVVIDAEKHNLNWKQSAIDNNIPQLKERYQGRKNAGASTLISRSTSEQRVNARKLRSPKDGGPIDPATGRKVYVETGESWTNSKGQTQFAKQKSTKMAETNDARTLISGNGGTKIEAIYADHANRLKSLANEARLETLSVKPTPYSPSAKKAYASEVASLNEKLTRAIRNRPLERQAQVFANKTVRLKRDANPDMGSDELKKIKAQALAEARARTGAARQQIHITDNEWNAIQAGAITNSKLTNILTNADLDRVKQLATPKTQLLMDNAKTQRAQSMFALGYTRAEVAEALGVSVSTLQRSLDG